MPFGEQNACQSKRPPEGGLSIASDRGRQISRNRGPWGRLWEQCVGPSPRPRQSMMVSITFSRASVLPIQTGFCARMRFISSSSTSISSVRRSFLDLVASALRSFSSAFSTESLGVSAMANLISRRPAFGQCQPRRNRATTCRQDWLGQASSGRRRGLLPRILIEDPWGVKIELAQDTERLGFHHIHLSAPDPAATLKWYEDMVGGKREKLKGQIEGLRYDGIWLLAAKSGATAPVSSGERAVMSVGWQIRDIKQADRPSKPRAPRRSSSHEPSANCGTPSTRIRTAPE